MLKSHFFKNNLIFAAGTLISGLLGYAFHFVVSRQISIAQYGELQSLLSVFIIFGVFNSTLSYFTIKHTSVFAFHRDRQANREFVSYLAAKIYKFALALLIVFVVFSPLLGHLLHFSSFLGFLVVSFATFFSTIMVIYLEVLRGWREFFLLSLAGLATAFVKFAAGAILAFLYHTTAAVSFSLLFSALAGWFLAKYWSRKKIINPEEQTAAVNWKNKYFSETNLRKSAAHIFLFSLALVLISNLDVVLVKYFSSAETAGRYGAFALLGKIVLWLNLAVIGVMLPEACSDGYQGKRLKKYNLLGSYGLMTTIAMGLIFLYSLAPNFVIHLFFGTKYIFDAQILWLFGLMSFLLSLLTLEANLAFAKHDFRVIYLLAGTLVLMIFGLAKFHANLAQMVLVFSTAFLIGYISIIVLNLSSSRPLPFLKGKLERNF